MLPTPHINYYYSNVYEPSEDSFLLLDALEKDQLWLRCKLDNKLTVVCEIGCGSGIVTTFMMQNCIPNKHSLYIPTDINPWAVRCTMSASVENDCSKMYLSPVQADLVSAYIPKCVDMLVFNPPYVPAETVPKIPSASDPQDMWLDVALEGGAMGMDVTNKILGNLSQILSSDGVAYIVFCARNKPEEVARRMRKQGWTVELIEHRKAGWEVLDVYKFYGYKCIV